MLSHYVGNVGYCRSPRGERGLKSVPALLGLAVGASLPARGAWIEMITAVAGAPACSSRSPRGERGLKYTKLYNMLNKKQVAPREGSVD